MELNMSSLIAAHSVLFMGYDCYTVIVLWYRIRIQKLIALQLML